MTESRSTRKKLYYSIGEVGEILDVNTSLIRYWEKEFPQIKPRKNRRGVRLFVEKDIETLRFIKHLVKDQGYTLDGAKKMLRQKDNQDTSEYQMVDTLTRLRAFLVEMKENF